ncbi:glycosyltransferase family 10 (fucosyltransferase) c-term domain-containing protein [Ditylenchus destructor]|nr:glycosyltransferase family 10 (fucosyltransferase) c-term domain-containing protein [Ditylenchus destructor]
MRKGYLCLCIGSTIITIFILYLSPQRNVEDYQKISITSKVTSENESSLLHSVSQLKRILIWTKVFGTTSLGVEGCPLEEKCQVTYDRSALNSSDAVVFHLPDLKLDDLPPPPQNEGPVYIFMIQESASSATHYHNLLSIPKNFFHWTSTILSESDAPFMYGYWVNPEEAHRRGFQRKKGEVFWTVSHCVTQSKREVAVAALAKHVNVDIIGKCAINDTMKNLCPRSSSCDELFTSYYFFIAAENSICKDYITEKYWTRYTLPSVPIVMKRNIYEGWIPNGSFIAMDDFDSPKKLGDHLKSLIQNPREYLKYFEWRSKGWARVPWNHDGFRTGPCKICELLLRNSTSPKKVIPDVAKWFLDTSDCESGEFALKWSKHKR